jgi:hypothetical protein
MHVCFSKPNLKLRERERERERERGNREYVPTWDLKMYKISVFHKSKRYAFLDPTSVH